MTDVLYLAWRYLAYHKVKTAVLISAVAVIVYLPVGLDIIVSRSAEELTARAQSTPLLIGAKGSPLELVLNSLYFESDTPPPVQFAEADRVDRSGLARAIPLYTRFHAAQSPIVGTTLEYFDFRKLELAEGRWMAMMGECVLGARAASTVPMIRSIESRVRMWGELETCNISAICVNLLSDGLALKRCTWHNVSTALGCDSRDRYSCMSRIRYNL